MVRRVATRRPKVTRNWRDAARVPFQPWCGRCDTLNAIDALTCEQCGCRLYPASFYPERKR